TDLKRFRLLMFLSGFVGMAAYFGNPQMMIIKALVIGIMAYKLFRADKCTTVATHQQQTNA
ncbi:hypothetical protein D9U34_21890, partial [Vibrio anguillarum]